MISERSEYWRLWLFLIVIVISGLILVIMLPPYKLVSDSWERVNSPVHSDLQANYEFLPAQHVDHFPVISTQIVNIYFSEKNGPDTEQYNSGQLKNDVMPTSPQQIESMLPGLLLNKPTVMPDELQDGNVHENGFSNGEAKRPEDN